MKPSLRSFEVVTSEKNVTFFLRALIEEYGAGDTYFELLGEVYHKHDIDQGGKSPGVLYEFRYGIHPVKGMTFLAQSKAYGYPEQILESLEVPHWGALADVFVSVRNVSDPKGVFRKGSPSDPRLLQALAVFHREVHYTKITSLGARQHLKDWIVAVVRRNNCVLYRAHKAIAELVG